MCGTLNRAGRFLAVFFITVVVLCAPALLLFGPRTTVWHLDSPTREYQIVGWLTDVGGFGYRGNYYLKQNRPFARWHCLGSGPSICDWTSDTTFTITGPGGTTGYSVDDYY